MQHVCAGNYKIMVPWAMAHVRKGKRNNWGDAQLAAALKEVKSKELSVRAAGNNGIPKSTLHDHL